MLCGPCHCPGYTQSFVQKRACDPEVHIIAEKPDVVLAMEGSI